MTNAFSEEQLIDLFRTQLPSMPIPAEFRSALQQKMLTEAVAGIKPTVLGVSRIAVSPARVAWFKRLLDRLRGR